MQWLTKQDLDWVLRNHYTEIIETFKNNASLGDWS